MQYLKQGCRIGVDVAGGAREPFKKIQAPSEQLKARPFHPGSHPSAQYIAQGTTVPAECVLSGYRNETIYDCRTQDCNGSEPRVSTDGQTAEARAKRGFSPLELHKGFPVDRQAGVLPRGAVPVTIVAVAHPSCHL